METTLAIVATVIVAIIWKPAPRGCPRTGALTLLKIEEP